MRELQFMLNEVIIANLVMVGMVNLASFSPLERDARLNVFK